MTQLAKNREHFCLIKKLTTFMALAAISLHSVVGQAAISVTDDAQHVVTLAKPAQRIISLAPHATELLFEAGAGSQIVGVSEYSDFPEAAKKIPSIGNVFALDVERIIALKPDLIVIWGTGNGKTLASKLRDTHIPIFESEPRSFEDIASSIERLAVLTDKQATGNAAAQRFRNRLEKLRQTYQPGLSSSLSSGLQVSTTNTAEKQRIVSVFYQIWRKPLMTLNDQHLVSAAIRLCGGKNIFGGLKEISPTVNTEAVLAANPDAIITTGGEQQDVFADWRQFTTLNAVSKGNLFTVKGDWMNRAGPRILDGTEMLCKHLATARATLK